MGPATVTHQQPMAVGVHPHIGLATFTYMLQGSLTHRDSTGVEMNILPGEVNLMVSGKGVVHSERSPKMAEGASMRIEGLQLWLALPLAHEQDPPSFTHLPAHALPKHAFGASSVTVVAGAHQGHSSPFHHHFSWPTTFLDYHLRSGPVHAVLPGVEQAPELAVYVVDGQIACREHLIEKGQLLVVRAGTTDVKEEDVEIELKSTDARVVAFGGQQLEQGMRHMWWNFVSSDQERIREAKRLYREAAEHAGDCDPLNPFGDLPPGEHEYMPLPRE